MIYC
ncbi:dee39c47-6c65-40e4-b677-15a97e252e8c [Thermothielavioides terrestris]|jgi:hypothetical protein